MILRRLRSERLSKTWKVKVNAETRVDMITNMSNGVDREERLTMCRSEERSCDVMSTSSEAGVRDGLIRFSLDRTSATISRYSRSRFAKLCSRLLLHRVHHLCTRHPFDNGNYFRWR